MSEANCAEWGDAGAVVHKAQFASLIDALRVKSALHSAPYGVSAPLQREHATCLRAGYVGLLTGEMSECIGLLDAAAAKAFSTARKKIDKGIDKLRRRL